MFREHISDFAQTLSAKVFESLKHSFGMTDDEEIQVISKSEYNKLVKKAIEKGGVDKLSKDEQKAMAIYQINTNILNAVDKASLEGVKTYQMTKEIDGVERDLFTNLKGDQLVQKLDEKGNPIDGEYEFADGSGNYIGFDNIYPQLSTQVTDDEGNLLFTDENGAEIKQISDADGNTKYVTTDENGKQVDYTGDTDKLSMLLRPYNLQETVNQFKGDMQNILEGVKNGNYPKEVSEADITLDDDDKSNFSFEDQELKKQLLEDEFIDV